MYISRFLHVRYLAIFILALVIAASTHAYAAANVVPESGAGDGSAPISGYTVTNVVYDLDSDGNPSTIDTVTFDISPTPTTVDIELVSGSENWFSCIINVAPEWGCSIGGAVNTVDADNLRVVASD